MNTPRHAVLAVSLQALHASLKNNMLKRSFQEASRIAEGGWLTTLGLYLPCAAGADPVGKRGRDQWHSAPSTSSSATAAGGSAASSAKPPKKPRATPPPKPKAADTAGFYDPMDFLPQAPPVPAETDERGKGGLTREQAAYLWAQVERLKKGNVPGRREYEGHVAEYKKRSTGGGDWYVVPTGCTTRPIDSRPKFAKYYGFSPWEEAAAAAQVAAAAASASSSADAAPAPTDEPMAEATEATDATTDAAAEAPAAAPPTQPEEQSSVETVAVPMDTQEEAAASPPPIQLPSSAVEQLSTADEVAAAIARQDARESITPQFGAEDATASAGVDDFLADPPVASAMAVDADAAEAPPAADADAVAAADAAPAADAAEAPMEAPAAAAAPDAAPAETAKVALMRLVDELVQGIVWPEEVIG